MCVSECVCERATWIKSAQQTNEETHERGEEAQGRKGTESDSVSLRKSVAEAVAVPESKQKAQSRRAAAAAAAASTSASAQRFFLFWCVCVRESESESEQFDVLQIEFKLLC